MCFNKKRHFFLNEMIKKLYLKLKVQLGTKNKNTTGNSF